MAQITPNQIVSACLAAMEEETVIAAVKRAGLILLAEIRDREVNFKSSSERRAVEAEEAMASLESFESERREARGE